MYFCTGLFFLYPVLVQLRSSSIYLLIKKKKKKQIPFYNLKWFTAKPIVNMPTLQCKGCLRFVKAVSLFPVLGAAGSTPRMGSSLPGSLEPSWPMWHRSPVA